jgi:hypothetical protein
MICIFLFLLSYISSLFSVSCYYSNADSLLSFESKCYFSSVNFVSCYTVDLIFYFASATCLVLISFSGDWYEACWVLIYFLAFKDMLLILLRSEDSCLMSGFGVLLGSWKIERMSTFGWGFDCWMMFLFITLSTSNSMLLIWPLQAYIFFLSPLF